MLEVQYLDHNGRGMSKLNNKIIFIENALPGELVEIKIDKEKKKFIEAHTTNIINKSNNRIDSICPYFNNCGGCDLLHLDYDNQLEFKQDKINNIVEKYLNQKITVNKIVKCDNHFNYRNKVTFQVKRNIGFFKDRTHEIINIDNCLISNSLINDSIKYLKKLDLNKINKITCRTGSNKLMIIIDTTYNDLNINAIKGIADSIYLKINNKYKLIYGNKSIIETLGDYKFIISPDSFFQINLNTCEKLYDKIKKEVGINKNILDLYCGTGSIGLYVNKNNNVLGIEVNSYAINDALENKKINSIDNINFLCGDSGKKANNITFKPDIIIVDPPRSGLNLETINNLFKLNSEKLIYVSCDPMTLVRDLNILSKNYTIIELTPFDMFPNTKHVESVCVLIHH